MKLSLKVRHHVFWDTLYIVATFSRLYRRKVQGVQLEAVGLTFCCYMHYA